MSSSQSLIELEFITEYFSTIPLMEIIATIKEQKIPVYLLKPDGVCFITKTAPFQRFGNPDPNDGFANGVLAEPTEGETIAAKVPESCLDKLPLLNRLLLNESEELLVYEREILITTSPFEQPFVVDPRFGVTKKEFTYSPAKKKSQDDTPHSADKKRDRVVEHELKPIQFTIKDLVLKSDDYKIILKSLESKRPIHPEIIYANQEEGWMPDILKEINSFAYINKKTIKNASKNETEKRKTLLFEYLSKDSSEAFKNSKENALVKTVLPDQLVKSKLENKPCSKNKYENVFDDFTPPTSLLIFINWLAKKHIHKQEKSPSYDSLVTDMKTNHGLTNDLRNVIASLILRK